MNYNVVPITSRQIIDGIGLKILDVATFSLKRGYEIRQSGRMPNKCEVVVFSLGSYENRERFTELSAQFALARDVTELFMLNDCALLACREMGLNLAPVGTIDETGVPEGRSLLLSVPYFH